MIGLYLWKNLEKDNILVNLYEAQQGDRHAYMNAISALLPFAQFRASTEDVIREYLVRALLCDQNAFTDVCVKEDISGSICNYALADLETLWREYFSVDWEKLADNLNIHSIIPYAREERDIQTVWGFDDSIAQILNTTNAQNMLSGLIKHLCAFGSGPMAEYFAYKWHDGVLSGLRDIDSGSLAELVGVDHQKEILIANTSAFLQGKPANHILLCGSMGSGKSSSVKALLSYFKKERLRLIEVGKRDIAQLEILLSKIDKERSKYIIFLDDLSFQGEDAQYSTLKVALDGQLSRQNKQVLFYATSNRRNLVRDNWIDRQGGGDLHENDTLNEQYSLSERFGIKLYFPSYDQNEYLAIVASRLASLGIAMDDELRKEALIWASHYHGRSGRTAANFVKNYCAQREE